MGTSFLVLGCGSIGRRHISNLRLLGIENIIAYDVDKTRLSQVASDFEVQIRKDITECFEEKPDAVIVCSPPHLHLTHSMESISNDSHVFVEKPISNVLEGLDKLIDLADRKNKVLMIGYNLRFNTALQKVSNMISSGEIGQVLSVRSEYGQYLPNWRPNQDYRLGYITHENTGGGIVLEESHEIDYVQWLCGETTSIFAHMEKISELKMQTEDMALMTLKLSTGVMAQINVDCVQRGYWRQCKIIGSDSTLLWNANSGISIIHDDPLKTKEITIVPDPNEAYINEIKHFIKCMEEGIDPVVGGKDAKQILEVALAAKDSHRLGRRIDLNPRRL